MQEERPKDPSVAVDEPLEMVNLSEDATVKHDVSISSSITAEERKSLIKLLKKFKNVFVWSYDEMPKLDPNLVAHSLNV